jgi:hypothetical protein
MSTVVIGERITVLDVEDRCTYWARVTKGPPGRTWDGAWFELLLEDAEHGGVDNGCLRALGVFDEGAVWIRGWHAPHEPAATALLAAGLLVRSAATD